MQFRLLKYHQTIDANYSKVMDKQIVNLYMEI